MRHQVKIPPSQIQRHTATGMDTVVLRVLQMPQQEAVPAQLGNLDADGLGGSGGAVQVKWPHSHTYTLFPSYK